MSYIQHEVLYLFAERLMSEFGEQADTAARCHLRSLWLDIHTVLYIISSECRRQMWDWYIVNY